MEFHAAAETSCCAYLVRLARQSAIDLSEERTGKRGFSQYEMSLSELETCVSKGNETQDTVDMKLLASAINQWLRTLPKENRIVFVGRYYFMDSIKDIADYCSMSQSRVKSMLFRSRASLREYLRKEGFDL
ncbi:MAG: RNA polymerase sigma factor [Anaerovoracaceae bacterium]